MTKTDNTLDKEIEDIFHLLRTRALRGAEITLSHIEIAQKNCQSLIQTREKKMLEEMGENIMNATFIDGAKVFWNGKTYKIAEIRQRAKEWGSDEV